MIEKIKIATTPDEKLILSFVVRAEQTIADNLLVEFTGYEMRKRLKAKRNRGYSGWNTAKCENSDLKERLLKNVETGDWIDVINLAAMLLARTRMFDEVLLGRAAEPCHPHQAIDCDGEGADDYDGEETGA